MVSVRAHEDQARAIDQIAQDVASSGVALSQVTNKLGDLQLRIRMVESKTATLELAITRIGEELASRRCSQEGNPDDEFYSDWFRWFIGDPDANVDYSRKQQRDRERLARGDFNRR